MSIRVLTNSSKFLQQLKEEMKELLLPQLKKARKGLRAELAIKIPKWIFTSMDYYLLDSKRNRVELGITEEQLDKAMYDIATVMVAALKIDITRDPGGLKLYFDQAALEFIKDMPSGKYISENGHLVQWLNWLLVAGSKIVVEGHHFTDIPGQGRIGGGVMFKGGIWRVPLEIRGDSQENLVTRIIDKKISEIYRLMRGHLVGDKPRLKYQ